MDGKSPPVRPKSKHQAQQQYQKTIEKCLQHQQETFQSYCKTHAQVCCKDCLTFDHQTCDIEDISKMARDIQTSGQLQDLDQKISMLKTGLNKDLHKAEIYRSIIQSDYSQATNDMKILRGYFERLMSKSEKQVEMVKEKDVKQNQSVFEKCNATIDKINEIETNFDKLKSKSNNEDVFISMKRVEHELQSMEESLRQLDIDNTVRRYRFEPEFKLRHLMWQLKVAGLPHFYETTYYPIITKEVVSISQQIAKTPTCVKEIKVSDKFSDLNYHGSVVLPNQQLLITDYHNKQVKLIDTNTGIELSKIQLSGSPANISKAEKIDDFAVLLHDPNKIQILNLSQKVLSIVKEIPVNGQCFGIAYNDAYQTFIMTLRAERTVEIMNRTGILVRSIASDVKHNDSCLFEYPYDVALSPCMNGIYVSDINHNSVTLLSIQGDVIAKYTDKSLKGPIGICVHKSGIVYVAGFYSNTVHQLNPKTGEFTILLDKQDGLKGPYSICYCDVEDKMYVGFVDSPVVKVFELK